MKKIIILITCYAIVMLTLTSYGFAYTILGTTGVDGLDSLVASHAENKDDTIGIGGYVNQNSRDFAMNILTSRDYNSLKTGNKFNEKSFNHFTRSLLYFLQDNSLTEWVVVDLSNTFGDNISIFNREKDKKIRESGSNVNPVPENRRATAGT